MRNPLRIIAPLVIATGLPLALAGVANADPLSITSCSLSPSTFSLAYGDSQPITVGWEDGVNTPGAVSDGAYMEMSLNGGQAQGGVVPIGLGGLNPFTVPYSFDQLSQELQGQAGTVTYSFYATDGTSKVGSALCSMTATVAAAPGSTTSTTVAPTTLPHTGSNTSTLLAGGAFVVAFGGALLAISRRRSIQ